MHNDDIERPLSSDDDPHDPHDGIIAADDTGLVSQQQVITQSELDEGMPDDGEAGGP